MTRILVSVMLLLVAGCGGGGGSSFSTGRFAFTAPSAEMAADFDELIFVDAEINGVRGRFLLDTGAGSFVIDSAFADRLGLEVVSQTTIITIAGLSPAEVRRVPELRIANIVGRDIDAAVLPLKLFDGVIGAPLFNAAIVTIDYENGIVRFDDPSLTTISERADELGAETLAIENLELSGVSVNGVELGPVLIDTGNAGGLNLPIELSGGLFTEETPSVPTVVFSLNGTTAGTAYVADQLHLGSTTLKNQIVVVQDSAVQSGLLGNLVLRQFIVVFDAGGGAMALRQDRVFEFGLISLPENEQARL